jgi:hypothetical protein
MSRLTHLDDEGRARMVDVSAKPATAREALAEGFVRMTPETRALAMSGQGKKGDVRAVAEIAGVGQADGHGVVGFNQLRRLFDMGFQIGAHGAGVSQWLALAQRVGVAAARGNAFGQGLAGAGVAQFQRAGGQAAEAAETAAAGDAGAAGEAVAPSPSPHLLPSLSSARARALRDERCALLAAAFSFAMAWPVWAQGGV